MTIASRREATDVTTFEVRINSHSDKAYNNGLCQVELLLTLVGTDLLSREELDSIRLVDEYTRQVIPVVDSSQPVPEGTWGMSTEKNAYDFHPPTRDAATSAREPQKQYYTCYVQTADVANRKKSIGARITLTSNGREVHSMDRSGSLGSVEVTPVPSPIPKDSAWDSDWGDMEEQEVAYGVIRKIYWLGLIFAGERHSIVSMNVVAGKPASGFRWVSPGSAQGGFFGFAPPGAATFTYSNVEWTGTYRPMSNDWDKSGRATVAFVRNIGLGPYQGAASASTQYELRSQYGTLYRVTIEVDTTCQALVLIPH